MKTTATIREFYTPIQPAAWQEKGPVLYTEIAPDLKLQDLIYCYWQLKTTLPLASSYQYRVVADGCMDIFFELENPQESFVMGFSKKYAEFPLGRVFNYVGIRFLPAMFPQLFRVSAAELSNCTEALHVVLPQTAAFICNGFSGGQNKEEIKSQLDCYFLEHLSKTGLNYDNRLYAALDLILQQHGMIKVETDLNTGFSPRQLRRIFGFYIGASAKVFSQVVRFQHILKAWPSAKQLRYHKLLDDTGYYDQSHFIKDFRNFYGVVPSQALSC